MIVEVLDIDDIIGDEFVFKFEILIVEADLVVEGGWEIHRVKSLIWIVGGASLMV